MKLRPVQLNKIEQILSDLERKVEEMEQQDSYIHGLENLLNKSMDI